jgi:N-acetylglucosaminyl-diphospho-decaprenol L-rhamnosyltransferase
VSGAHDSQPADAPITIAVVAWNTRDLLARCLNSMSEEVEAGRATVTVVDNGSSDGSREMVRADYRWAELIEPDQNLGFGRAVNLVADRSSSPWLVAANADIELTPGALEALLQAGQRQPEAGAVAPRLVLPDGSTQHSVHQFPSPGLAALFGFGLYRLSGRLADRLCIDGFWNPDRRREVDWAHGAFLLLRRDSFDLAGCFDEAQWMYAEDIDLAWRLKESGHPVHYEPQAAVRHAVSASARQAFGDFERDQRHILASYVWLARRRGVAIARLTAALNAAGAALRLLIFSPLALLAPGRWSASRDAARRHLSLHKRGLRVGPSTGTP